MEIEISYNRYKNKIHSLKKHYETHCGLTGGSKPEKIDAILFLEREDACKICKKAVSCLLNKTIEHEKQ